MQQVQVWNNSYAFAYPAFSSNACTGELGMSFEYGGNGNYENHVVGFWGDFVAYITTNSDAGTDRFGEYVTIRRAPPTQNDSGKHREEDRCAICSLWQALLPRHSIVGACEGIALV